MKNKEIKAKLKQRQLYVLNYKVNSAKNIYMPW